MDDEDLDKVLQEVSNQDGKINLKQGYELICNSIIRPPRNVYDLNQLGPTQYKFGNHKFIREDIQLVNNRGLNLQCSLYRPENQTEKRPCVVYCHGNGGSRMDAFEAFKCVLPVFNLFTFDFSGSGISDGEYVSLGMFEKDDLETIINYLLSSGKISRIGIWGRSMGAVASLLYVAGSNNPNVSALVFDSPFSSLKKVSEELVEKSPIKVPKMMVGLGLRIVRRTIKNKALFDIFDLEPVKLAPKARVPALFCHAKDDTFIASHHSKFLHDAYGGQKNLIMVEGDHNTIRPSFFYDSVVIFFHNHLLTQKEKEAIESEGLNDSPEGMPSMNGSSLSSTTTHQIKNPFEDEDAELTKALAESLALSQEPPQNTQIQDNAVCPICSKTIPNASIEQINQHIDACLSQFNSS